MFIGIDIGGTNIKGVLTNKGGEIFSSASIPTGKTADDIENGIVSLIDVMTDSKSLPKRSIKALGIGAAGAVDCKKGVIITSPNIRAWENYPLANRIERRVGIRVFLENDATVAVIGEWWMGQGRKYRNWIMLTLGTGVGGGAVIDNKLYTGQSGSSMEFGHMTIDYKGRKCKCGNIGCLEQYASASAIVNSARIALKKDRTSSIHKKIESDEARKGDTLAVKLVEEMSYFLGIGVANLVNIFNPEAVILGGGLSRDHRIIIPVVRRVVNERALPGLKDNVKYLAIKNEDKAPALGAAKIAMDSLQHF
jgi:glucokinase